MRIINFSIILCLLTPLFLGMIISVNEFAILPNNNNEFLTDYNQNSTPKPSASSKNWTFMVYLDADCNLEEAGIDDINEMEMEGSDSNINVVVQIDRIPGYDSTNGNWYGAKRYYITKDYNSGTISSTVLQDLGEVNMGSASVLQNFIQWAKTNYPADNYALILWDHGSGIMWGNYPGGVCWDDSNGNDYLTLSELSNVLSSNSVNLLGFDACLMGATEVHYQLKDYVDVIIGSEDLEPGDGYPYNDILNYLRLNPDATPVQLSEQIVIKYNNFYSNPWYSVTQASVDALDPDFIDSITAFISDLDNALQLQKDDIQDARAASLEFDEESYIDLYDFANEIQARCSGSIDNSAQKLKSNITNNIIIKEAHSASQAGAHGLSIYFPKSYSDYSSIYENSTFAQDLQWDEFLIKYHTGSTTGEYDDEFEENDMITDAKILSHGIYNNLILNASDLDFYNVSLEEGDNLKVDILFDDDEGNLDLELYNTTGDKVNYSHSTNDNEHLSYIANADGFYTILVDQNGTEYPYQPYDLIINDGKDDAFEQNDDYETAAEIVNNTIYTDLVCKDPDFYKFWATEGYLINLTIKFEYNDGDLDLYLWNNTSPQIIAGSNTATDNENILWFTDYSGWYVVEVYNYEDNLNYSLNANVIYIDDGYEYNNYINLAAPITPGIYNDLVCINDDFYNVTLNAGYWVNVTIYFEHDEGDLDLYLIYVSSWDPFNYDYVGISGSYTDDETVFYEVDITGSYYILVDNYEINLNYRLCISNATNIWDDDFEENDWFDDASQLDISGIYNNLTAIDWDTYYFYVPQWYQIIIIINYNCSEGDLDLYLIDYDVFDDIAWIIDTSVSYSDQEQIIYETQYSGNYYILVYLNDINMEYNLTLIKNKIPISLIEGNDDDDDDDEIIAITGIPVSILTILIALTVIFLIKKKFSENNK